jgi:hypothetical protein
MPRDNSGNLLKGIVRVLAVLILMWEGCADSSVGKDVSKSLGGLDGFKIGKGTFSPLGLPKLSFESRAGNLVEWLINFWKLIDIDLRVQESY